MKIFDNNKVYVQKKDINYLIKSDLPMPTSISMKLCEYSFAHIGARNQYEFMEFENEEEIEFFKSVNFIVDYDKVKDLSKEEITVLIDASVDERNSLALRLNAMPLKEQEKHIDMINRCNFLEFTIRSLRDILSFRDGRIQVELPIEGVEASNKKNVKKKKFNIFRKKGDIC